MTSTYFRAKKWLTHFWCFTPKIRPWHLADYADSSHIRCMIGYYHRFASTFSEILVGQTPPECKNSGQELNLGAPKPLTLTLKLHIFPQKRRVATGKEVPESHFYSSLWWSNLLSKRKISFASVPVNIRVFTNFSILGVTCIPCLTLPPPSGGTVRRLKRQLGVTQDHTIALHDACTMLSQEPCSPLP